MCLEGLDPHVEDLTPLQFSSLDKFYSFFDHFLSENYALDQIPKITGDFESAFLSHYRSFLQMRPFANTTSNWAASAPKLAPLMEQALAGPIRPFLPCALPQHLTTTINSLPPLPPNKPVDPQVPWMIMGEKKKSCNKPCTFATAITGPTQPSHTPSPIMTTNQICDLTDTQLQSLTRDKLIEAYEVHFNCHVMSHSASKIALITAYKRELAKLPLVPILDPNPPKQITCDPAQGP